VWQSVTEGRDGVKIGQKQCDILYGWPRNKKQSDDYKLAEL